jgi:hypothetical protein
MSFTFAALKALRTFLDIRTVHLCGHEVKTDATQLHPDYENLQQCTCNVIVKSLVESKPLQCQCPSSFSKAMGTSDIRVHVVLFYGIQKGPWNPLFVPPSQLMLHEQLKEENGNALLPDLKALIFYGKTERPQKMFKSQVYLASPRVCAETIRADILKQLS